MAKDKFELVLYGLKDPDPKKHLGTAKSIAQYLSLDLKLAIDIISEFPVQVLTGASEEELKSYYNKLTLAGCEAKIEPLNVGSDSYVIQEVNPTGNKVYVLSDDPDEESNQSNEEDEAFEDSYDEISNLISNLEKSSKVNKAEETRHEDILKINELNKKREELVAKKEERKEKEKKKKRKKKKEKPSENKKLVSSSKKIQKVKLSPKIQKALKSGSRKTANLIKNTVIASIVGVSISLFFLTISDKDKLDKKSEEMKKKLNTVVKQLKDIEEDEKIELDKVQHEDFFVKFKNENYNLNGKYEYLDGKLIKITINISTPQPNSLTDLELVNKVEPPPWIKRITLENLKITNKDNQEFLGLGTANIFVIFGKEQYRMGADAVITGIFNVDKKEVMSKLLLNKGFSELPKDSDYVLEHEGGKLFNLFISSDFILKTRKKKKVNNIDSSEPINMLKK